jgi:hypothetical protein
METAFHCKLKFSKKKGYAYTRVAIKWPYSVNNIKSLKRRGNCQQGASGYVIDAIFFWLGKTNRRARSQSLYRLSYPAHNVMLSYGKNTNWTRDEVLLRPAD